MTKPVMARHIHSLGWFSDIWHPIEINRLGPEHVRQDQEKHLHFASFLAFTFFCCIFRGVFVYFVFICFYGDVHNIRAGLQCHVFRNQVKTWKNTVRTHRPPKKSGVESNVGNSSTTLNMFDKACLVSNMYF